MKRKVLLRWMACGLLVAASAAAHADEALWALLGQGGQVVLIRHAVTTPGTGDPPGMKLEDCASQRNLSDEGRREAARLGAALKQRKVPVARVLSSPWCRCLETARIAFGRAPAVNAALGNLFGRPERSEAQVAEMKKLVAKAPRGGNLFLVTHGSTTNALTGVSPGTAEMVILTPQPGGFKVAGRLPVG